jgi:hypothetical protein
MIPSIAPDDVDRLTGGRLGTFDLPCPMCGPFKRTVRNQLRRVLRVYRIEPGFAGFHCARCGEKGAVIDRGGTPPDPVKVEKARLEAADRDRTLKAKRLRVARWLWSVRKPIAGTIAEKYIRDVRGYSGPHPPTLGFLPPRYDYPPAIVGAFGLALECAPGEISIADAAVRGVHLTRLLPDGSGKAVFEDPDEQAKIMIGYSAGFPIVLAPMNDGLALGVTEGLEDGLSIWQSLGIGVWVAGSSSRLPALAEIVPACTDTAIVFAHNERDGQRHASRSATTMPTTAFGKSTGSGRPFTGKRVWANE